MAEPKALAPLLAALRALVDWLDARQVSGMVIGGVAASLLGRPRVTRDIDAVILLDESRWPEFLASAETAGFDSRLPDALQFAAQARVFLMRHRSSGIDVDIALGSLPFEQEAIARAITVDAGGLSLPMSTPEDLIVMKAVAQRARDLADIESVLDAQPDLDLPHVRRWVRAFARALDQPQIARNFEKILRARAQPRRERQHQRRPLRGRRS